MRRRYRYDPDTDSMVEITAVSCETHVQTVPDIEPYRSMITGEMITGRAQHREHLKRHDRQEVGNERPDFTPPDFTPPAAEVRASIMEAKRQIEWGEEPTLERLKEESPRWRKEMGLE